MLLNIFNVILAMTVVCLNAHLILSLIISIIFNDTKHFKCICFFHQLQSLCLRILFPTFSGQLILVQVKITFKNAIRFAKPACRYSKCQIRLHYLREQVSLLKYMPQLCFNYFLGFYVYFFILMSVLTGPMTICATFLFNDVPYLNCLLSCLFTKNKIVVTDSLTTNFVILTMYTQTMVYFLKPLCNFIVYSVQNMLPSY